jgi:hypothetical protein
MRFQTLFPQKTPEKISLRSAQFGFTMWRNSRWLLWARSLESRIHRSSSGVTNE